MIKLEKEEEIAHVSFEWEDYKLSVTVPYLPYLDTLFSERVIKEVFTNLYDTVLGVLADLGKVISDYKEKAKDLAHEKEYPMGWW